MTLTTLCLLFAAILLEVLGQICFKLGTRQASRIRSAAGADVFHAGYLNRWIGLGLAAYVVELTVWLAVLSTSQLSRAFPLLALSYCGVAIASRFIFKELLRPPVVAGICFISFGAAMILWSS
jgi:undecaprenyl phosphate-alpha-L-ara4N flippase subunit ArnE